MPGYPAGTIFAFHPLALKPACKGSLSTPPILLRESTIPPAPVPQYHARLLFFGNARSGRNSGESQRFPNKGCVARVVNGDNELELKDPIFPLYGPFPLVQACFYRSPHFMTFQVGRLC